MDYGLNSHNIVLSGKLEKRRDGAVRGGWAARTFILTNSSLYYYRKILETDMLGQERGQILISDILSVKSLSEEEVTPSAVEADTVHYFLEIVTKNNRTILARVPGSESSICDTWTSAILDIQNGIEVGDSLNTSIQNLLTTQQLEAKYISDIIAISILLNANNGLQQSLNNEENEEWIVKRSIKWFENVDLGILPQGAACCILFGGGGSCRVGTQALMSSWDSGTPCWASLIDTDYPTELKMSAHCEILRQKSEIKNQEKVFLLPSSFLLTIEDISALLYLFVCIFSHFVYGSVAVHWLNKCCVTIGAALAITTIMNNSSKRNLSKKTEFLEVNHQKITEIRFSITLLQLKVCRNGKLFLYPQQERKDSGVSGHQRESNSSLRVMDNNMSKKFDPLVKKMNSSCLFNWLQNEKEGIVIDCRSSLLYEEGHLVNAIHFPKTCSSEEIEKILLTKSVFQERTNKELVLYYDRTKEEEEWAIELSNVFLKESKVKSVKLLGDSFSIFSSRYNFLIKKVKPKEQESKEQEEQEEPIVQYPNEIIEGFLFAGHSEQAYDEHIINMLQITHVINCDKMCVDRHKDLVQEKLNCCSKEEEQEQGKKALDFQAIYDFIDHAKRRPGSRLLVHCCSNISESISLLIWYSMKTQHSSLVTAYNYVLQRRPTRKPTIEGILELMEQEYQLYQRNSLTKEEIPELLADNIPNRTLNVL